MSDGAQLGVGAERALATILGGEPQPSLDEIETVEQMRERILATTEADATTYDGMATFAAKLILEYLLADPRRAAIPTENVYEKDENGRLVFNSEGGLNLVTPGLYEVMKADGIPLDKLGLTGFMWDWAVNAARRCVEAPAVPNPAILTIHVPERSEAS